MTDKQWMSNLGHFHSKGYSRPLVEFGWTLVPYLAILGILGWMVTSGVRWGFWVPLWLIAAGFYTRLFIIFHDCAHLSYLPKKRGCRYIGFLTGVLTFTPYEEWRRTHMIHHGTVGNIDRRGTGDVWTMTAEEYRQSSWWRRGVYRAFRHPLVLFVFSPLILFLVLNRLPKGARRERETRSIMLTNLAILAIVLITSKTVGFRTYALVQLPIVFIASSFGVWLFYVQHQFETVYWSHQNDWSLYEAAMKGSSFYRLPGILRWLTGNIGYHHIHHLDPGIPFYELKHCQESEAALAEKEPLTFWRSLRSIRFKVYDENQQRMVRFRDLKSI